MRRAALLVLLAVLAAGTVPATAATPRLPRGVSSRIVPQRSLAGSTFTDTVTSIRRKLGTPSQTIRVGGKVARIAYDRPGLAFGFDTLDPGTPLQLMATTDRRFSTSSATRYGSTRAAVLRAYEKLDCSGVLCTLYRGQPGVEGTLSTGFTFFRGRVSAIVLQVVR